ncbi:Cyclic di-GMP phosphodiesterase response regulator RpfG [Rubrivivax sp. A210]|uniref:HD domain-containing phosphohydrolase n=1 Tax=Rubrivivax sp. A210 TaxID=2772301 RepID=UPI0019182892|nr:HD domain-containing phosphohydrolase [Rubrivivax sp. A210]CAD5373105.1 Cyclic di-GMP phosphodiesterase response regulator RpfG [Rubrivivax sp. A210]
MKVVIVDDVQMNVTLLQHLVRKLADCEAHSFTDPHKALAWCQDGEPDLIVTDYMMPGLNGIELVQRLHERLPDVPTLMITANHEKELRHEALQAGVTDFLNKPLDNTEFLARARNMLALSVSRKKLADRAQWLKEEVDKATQDLARQAHETILCLSRAAEHRDPETGAHILRMSHYSRHIARCLGLSQADQDLLLAAAPMHDVGKVGTPDLILLKPGPLTAEEFEVMKLHTVIGWKVLKESTSPLLQKAAEIAYTHHERYDGSGYPRGLAGGMVGDRIPIFGRIVAVADVFDALTSARPYKRSWTIERSLALLDEGRGKHFDPACVDAFLNDWDEVLEIKQRFADEAAIEAAAEAAESIR